MIPLLPISEVLSARRSRLGGRLALIVLGALLLGASSLRAQDSTNTGGDSVADFKSFEIIANRNIFDPTRSGRARSYGPTKARPPAQTFSFCGIGEAAFGKQHFAAMFDGYGNPGRQLYVGDVINGYKVVRIPPPARTNGWRASVQLAGGTNQTITLFQGMGMRREQGEAWVVSDQIEPTPAAATATTDNAAKTSSDSSSSGTASSSESEIVKRLRLQREQEDK